MTTPPTALARHNDEEDVWEFAGLASYEANQWMLGLNYGSYASYCTAKTRAYLRKKDIPFVEHLPRA